jgi:hypothetical protein
MCPGKEENKMQNHESPFFGTENETYYVTGGRNFLIESVDHMNLPWEECESLPENAENLDYKICNDYSEVVDEIEAYIGADYSVTTKTAGIYILDNCTADLRVTVESIMEHNCNETQLVTCSSKVAAEELISALSVHYDDRFEENSRVNGVTVRFWNDDTDENQQYEISVNFEWEV